MRLVQVVGYAVILCFGSLVGSAWAQSDPPQPTGVFPPVILQFLPSLDPTGIVETSILTRHRDGDVSIFENLGPTAGRAPPAMNPAAHGCQHGFNSATIRAKRWHRSDFPSERWRDLSERRFQHAQGQAQGVQPVADQGPDPNLPAVARDADFNITALNDPYGCTTLTSSPPVVSVYRRPLPSANLEFLIGCPASDPGCAPLAIMWDGRKSRRCKARQSTRPTATRKRAPLPLTPRSQLSWPLEPHCFDAQVLDYHAGYLGADGATGGPAPLSQQEFYEGINDVLSPGFDPVIFTDYAPWENLLSSHLLNRGQASVARGEIVFNTKPITITGVNGLNLFASDPLGAAPFVGTCGTCHDSPNVGNHSKKLAIDIGIADASPPPPALDISGLPVFTVTCTAASPLGAGYRFTVTDLGKATISGKCQDVGKVKGPILRGLAARAPYFQNGSAATLTDVVNFYDQRFAIGLTAQETADLVAFLQTL